MITGRQDLILYHVSAVIVEHPDIMLCRKRNDFGRGFYLTTSQEQAERFVKTAVLKSGKKLTAGVVNRYSFDSFEGLSTKEFVSTDREWLHCVCEHRKPSLSHGSTRDWNSFDVMIGKIANDDTMATISIYLSDGFGTYGTDEAIETAICLLKPERLKDQICLRTEVSLQRLCFAEAYEVKIV